MLVNECWEICQQVALLSSWTATEIQSNIFFFTFGYWLCALLFWNPVISLQRPNYVWVMGNICYCCPMNLIQSLIISCSWLCWGQTVVSGAGVLKAEGSIYLLSSWMQQEQVAESQQGPGSTSCSCTIPTWGCWVLQKLHPVLLHLLKNFRPPVPE